MNKTTIDINGISLPLISLDVAVIGSGCAGFNAADWLFTFGRQDIAIITEGLGMGTSRNTGSDKQTYYKLSLASDGKDSVAEMAADLFAGEGVSGDNALAEAAGSVRSFIKLCNLGVPFPVNEYGEYVGYKTDHDPRQRATSAGPLTSKMMTECLERAVLEKGIPILDGLTVVKLLTTDSGIEGLICLDSAATECPSMGLTLVRARRVILATGGPAGCYLNSVYPKSQSGMSGLALEAGAEATNLQEWQYGLASIGFRWNVSGTYQQVLPRFISVDSDGNEREFLLDYFENPCRALDMVFLKGYQWPFDTNKIEGSSLIDILVHTQTAVLGRRVYMDFRRNPSGLERGFGGLGEEANRYLSNSDALFGTPIERLERMNHPAIDLYKQNGIDLYNQPLEIGVCAQHHNGGISVDANWLSTLPGLYVAGEAAGTFGNHRPGGSALNSTQVGSLRAAEHIACTTHPDTAITPQFKELALREAATLLGNMRKTINPDTPSTVEIKRYNTAKAMSLSAGHLRDFEGMEALENEIKNILTDYFDSTSIENVQELSALMKTRDILITQLAVLSAMRKAAEQVGSRGSALVTAEDGLPVLDKLHLRYLKNRPMQENCRMVTKRKADGFDSSFEPVRPLPQPNGWFETVWNDYRRRTANIYNIKGGEGQ